jgi:hypothetical protein
MRTFTVKKFLFVGLSLLIVALLFQQGCKPRRSKILSDDSDALQKHLSYISVIYAQFKETPFIFLPQAGIKEAEKEREITDGLAQSQAMADLNNEIQQENAEAAGQDDPIERLLDYIYMDYEFDIRIFAAEVLYEMAYTNLPHFLFFSRRGQQLELNALVDQIFTAIRRPLDAQESSKVCTSHIECLKKLETLTSMSRWTELSNTGMNPHARFDRSPNNNNDGRIRSMLKEIQESIQSGDFGDVPLSNNLAKDILLFSTELSSLWIEVQMASRIHSLYGFDTYYYGSIRQKEIQNQIFELISRFEKRFFDESIYAKVSESQVTGPLVHIFTANVFKDFYKIFVAQEFTLSPDEYLFYLQALFGFESFEAHYVSSIRQAYVSAIKLWHFNNTFKSRNPKEAYECLNNAAKILNFRDESMDLSLDPIRSNCLNRALTRNQVLDVYLPEIPVIEQFARSPYRKMYSAKILEMINLDGVSYDRIADGTNFEYKKSLFVNFAEQAIRDQDQAISTFFAQNNLPVHLGGDQAEQYLAENLKGFRSWSAEIDKMIAIQLKNSHEMAYLQTKMQNNRSGEKRQEAVDNLMQLLKDDPISQEIYRARIRSDDKAGEEAKWRELSWQHRSWGLPYIEIAAYYTGFARVAGWFNEGKVRNIAAKDMASVSRQELLTPLKFACLNKYYETHRGSSFDTLKVIPAEREAAKAAPFLTKMMGCPIRLIDLDRWHSNSTPVSLPQEGAFNLNAICPHDISATSNTHLTKHFDEYLARYNMHTECSEVTQQFVMQVASFAVMVPAFKVGFGFANKLVPLLKNAVKGNAWTGPLISRFKARYGIMNSSQFGPGYLGLTRNITQNSNSFLASLMVRGGEYMVNSAIRGLSFTLMNKIFMLPLSGPDGILALEAGQSITDALKGRSGFALYREIGQGVIFGMIGPSFDGISRWSNVSLYSMAGRTLEMAKQGLSRVGTRYPRLQGAFANTATNWSYALAHSLNSGGTRGLGVVLFEEAWVFPFDLIVTHSFYALEEYVTGEPAYKESFAEFLGNNLLGVFILRRKQLPHISQSAGMQTLAHMRSGRWIDSRAARIRNRIERIRHEPDPHRRALINVDNDLRYLGITELDLIRLKEGTGRIEVEDFNKMLHAKYDAFKEAHGNERFDQGSRLTQRDIRIAHAKRYRGDGVYTNFLDPKFRDTYLAALNDGVVRDLSVLADVKRVNYLKDLGLEKFKRHDLIKSQLEQMKARSKGEPEKLQKIENALKAYEDQGRFETDVDELSGRGSASGVDPVDLSF